MTDLSTICDIYTSTLYLDYCIYNFLRFIFSF